MTIRLIVFCYICVLLNLACRTGGKKPPGDHSAIKLIETPGTRGGEPNLYLHNENVLLSWIEYLDEDTDVLMFSALSDDTWSAPKTIASGSNWFVNWADFPSVVGYLDKEEQLVAHWLQKSAEGTYDYDVHLAQSKDGGEVWSSSFTPHKDGIAAEHGFISLLPLTDDKVLATWLDGRNTKQHGNEEHSDVHSASYGSMTLRTATFDINGKMEDEEQLDSRVCDCCQTTAALTTLGPIIAYRDRSEREVRDIAIVRRVNGSWTEPKLLSDDNWKIAGCPVNGPAMDAKGSELAIAWFTMAEDSALVKLSFSNDSGANFSEPLIVNEGVTIGRVDIILLRKDKAVVSWIEESEHEASLLVRIIHRSGKKGTPQQITKLNSSRKSGFPKMVKRKNELVFAWTEGDEISRVQTAILDLFSLDVD